MPRPYPRNIALFYVYQTATRLSFWVPVWVLYLQHQRGLTLTQITLLDAVFWAVSAASEIPTGVIADVWSRKWSIALGTFLQVWAILLYGTASTYGLLMLANILWAVSMSCVSGAEQALLYDTLQAQGRERAYLKVGAVGSALMQAAGALGALGGGLMADVHITLPFLVTAAMHALGLAALLLVGEPPSAHAIAGAPAQQAYRNMLSEGAGLVWKGGRLRYLMAYAALLPLPALLFPMTFLQPYAYTLGLSLGAIGVIVMGLRVVGVLASLAAHAAASWLGDGAILLLAPVLMLGCMVSLGLWPSTASIALFAILIVVTSLARPLVETLVHQACPSRVRSTIMSLGSLLMTAVLLVVEPAIGALSDWLGLPYALLIFGLAMSIPLLVLGGLIRAAGGPE
jgi:MFS family permease